MGVAQVVTCDCCSEVIASASVLDAVIVTSLAEGGEVVQTYYGRACGCGQAAHAAVAALPHEEHVAPEPETSA